MLSNMFYNTLYQIVTLLTPIIVTPYVSRILGSSGIGEYALAYTYAQYFILAGGLGLFNYGCREIAYVRDQKEKLKSTFWELVFLRTGTYGLVVIVYFIIFYMTGFKQSAVYQIMIIYVAANIFDISWFYIGIEDFKQRAIKSSGIKLATIVLVMVFVKKSDQTWLYALIMSLGNLIGTVILWDGIFKILPGKVEIKSGNLKRHLHISFTMFITSVIIYVYTMLDKIMLGEMVGVRPVGYYENAEKIVRPLATFITAAMQAVYPTLANYFIKGENEKFQQSIYHSFRIVCFCTFPLAFGLAGVAKSFSAWYFGSNFTGIDELLVLGSPMIISLGMTSILGNNILVTTNRQNMLTFSVFVGAVLDIVLNFCFIPRYGATAAMAATLIAEITGLVLMLYFVRKDVKICKLFQGSFRYFFLAAFMYFILFCTRNIFGTTFLSTIGQMIIGAGIYFSGLIILRDTILSQLAGHIKSAIKKAK